jgi:hypothetical protein
MAVHVAIVSNSVMFFECVIISPRLLIRLKRDPAFEARGKTDVLQRFVTLL